LVKSTIGIYDVWVHWSMTIDTTSAISHFINGQPTILPRDQVAYCGSSTGALVIGHDQDAVGGALDPNQARSAATHGQ
jgi:hypothetical protein